MASPLMDKRVRVTFDAFRKTQWKEALKSHGFRVKGDDAWLAREGFVGQVKLVKSRWNIGVFVSFHLEAHIFAFEGQPASAKDLLLRGRHLGLRFFPALARGDGGAANLDNSLRALGVPEETAAALRGQQRAIDAVTPREGTAPGRFTVGLEETPEDLGRRVLRELESHVLPWFDEVTQTAK